jgi:hypothetical protein
MPAPTVVGTNFFCGLHLRLGVFCRAFRHFSTLAGEFPTCGEGKTG